MKFHWVNTALIFSIMVGSAVAQASFLPQSVLRNARPADGPSNISQAQFTGVVTSLQSLYAPLVSKLGGSLSIKGDWSNDKLVAQSTQMFGSWVVEISGGLARRPELSADGLSLIICHELGHHMGGFPYMNRGLPIPIPLPGGLNDVWAATEGQADYYSTQVCAKKLWASDLELNATFKDQADPVARDQCDTAWHTDAERNLCYRTVTGVATIMKTMAVLLQKPMPQFSTPDPSTVATTFTDHPAVQCRLDTVFSGAICTASHDDSVIPGKKATDFPDGLESERDAAKYYCTQSGSYVRGLRPACWFKARL